MHSSPTRTLGSTGIAVDAITIGTSPLGRDTDEGSAEERSAVDFAIDILTGPFALVDTSNEYAGGRSEQVLGAALAELGDRATSRIVTKVDRDPLTGDFSRDRVLRSYEESLARLGVDRVEILHLHDPFTVTFAEASARGGAVEALVELREQGAVDAIGIAAGDLRDLLAYVRTDVFDVVLCHNRFTLVDQSAVPLFGEARERGMGVFNAAPFGAGLLSTGARAGASYGYRPASDELLAWTARAEGVCAEHGVTLPAAALHFSLRSPLVDSTVVGVSSTRRLNELAALGAASVPDELWPALAGLGAAPTPYADA
ncbi:aldo/keto reductase [Planococcus sp. APC 4015]|nr:aldo/keto reductase [Planococcus sp. APC 4015]